MTPAIRTESLTKYYADIRGVENLNLEVKPGEVFGFLGPNGAGKSTTIRVLLDFIRPTAGSAEVLGLGTTANSIEIHRRVGYLPGELALYDRMTGEELLRYFGALRDVTDLSEAHRVAEILDLDLSRTIRSYSSGNRQKLGLAQAFLHRPELLILDEPTNGLDPLIQQAFYGLVNEVRADGRTMFLSSHVLPEVERIADRVGIIRGGNLVAVSSVAEFKAKAVHRLELRFGEEVAASAFEGVSGVRSVAVGDAGHVAHLQVEGSVDAAIKVAARYELINLISHEGDLEEAFLAFYAAPGEAQDAH
jgi:ABC-2 type transport system ATP-binding protein